MKRNMPSKHKEIEHISEVRVRFVETDPLGIVWHGNYIQYFEDGRESFGREHGISYLNQKEHGFATPIIKSSTDHKRPLRYGDVATIKTIYVDSPAAKMIFRYEIYNQNKALVCTGETVQVFVDDIGNGELWLNIPEFFMDWKKQVGLL
ncbi:acyl-CoA thioesterase [Tamlana haliotis]|uniref:Acyl-CoA thioesterase n=1 Tax=Pseudotamlana haliotis TaxID=2614804 RepID=A0A6N6MIW2_9FLAO|nr:acyl-CoA thioesterase [Tamlana haliotis]KAB1069019.1 acyl-CoA thioesterase [Tamlana haliotis]